MTKDVVPATAGALGVTFPAWGNLVTSWWEGFIAILGAIVLVLTIWNKWLEIKQRRAEMGRK